MKSASTGVEEMTAIGQPNEEGRSLHVRTVALKQSCTSHASPPSTHLQLYSHHHIILMGNYTSYLQDTVTSRADTLDYRLLRHTKQ